MSAVPGRAERWQQPSVQSEPACCFPGQDQPDGNNEQHRIHRESAHMQGVDAQYPADRGGEAGKQPEDQRDTGKGFGNGGQPAELAGIVSVADGCRVESTGDERSVVTVGAGTMAGVWASENPIGRSTRPMIRRRVERWFIPE